MTELASIQAEITTLTQAMYAVLTERRTDVADHMRRTGHTDDEVITFIHEQWERDKQLIHAHLMTLTPVFCTRLGCVAPSTAQPAQVWPPMPVRTVQ